ncbi:MAG TPA: SpoIIE family protein phosphatase [Steroidobacteraceae bacterium]
MRAVAVVDPSQIAQARREAAEAAAAIAFNTTDAGRVALVASELATNLIKHGGGGELLIGSYDDPTGTGIELIALDKGPGIANVQACLEDGYSSAGTAGHGLGAIRRQSQAMEIVSWQGMGTAVLARLASGARHNGDSQQRAPWGSVSVALQGEEVCGDACIAVETTAGRTLIVADGLGHGAAAATASMEAIRLFERYQSRPVAELLEYLHSGLRSTRGAAIAVARFDPDRGKVVYGGIGNIAGVVLSSTATRRMVSLNGTAGHVARKVQTFDYPITDDGVVVMNSDGLATSWSLQRYPGLLAAHPSLIAAVLYRDFSRRRDDVTVLVARVPVSDGASAA